MTRQAALFCILLLRLYAVTFVTSYADSIHKWGGKSEGASKKDQTDPVVLADENDAQSQLFGGIQADSLGENSQATFNTNAEKEAVMHELDDGGPVFNHDASSPNTAKEEIGKNDMSQYESEDINLVGNARHKNVKSKPVRLPSLVEEGKIDTFIAKPKSTDENESLKIVKPADHKENMSSKTTVSPLNKEKVQIDSSEPTVVDAKSKNSDHRSLKAQSTKHRSFASSVGASNLFDLPDLNIDDDDDILPKSSKLLLGESDDSSAEKLRKSGERLTMFYDRDSRKKKQSVARKIAGRHGDTGASSASVNVKGGQIVGGQISGGNIFGGDIEGGLISGGTIKGGIVKGGRMSQGLIDGGLFLDGDMAGGFLHNGTVKGGVIRGGNITGGTVTGGEILGGHVSSGFVSGGVLKAGGVEGGMLKGGTIDGGILKGGVMERGKLLGGIVWNGRVTGGTILGGEVLGGEVGEGVVIRGGKINGTVTVGRKMVSSSGGRLGSLDPLRHGNTLHGVKPQNQASLQFKYHPHKLLPVLNAARPYRPPSSQYSIEGDVGGRVNSRPILAQSIPRGRPNGVSSGNIANDAVVINRKNTPNVILLSNISRNGEQIKRNYRPNDFFNRQPYSNPNYQAINSPAYANPNYGFPATSTSAAQYQAPNSVPNPSAASVPQAPPQNGININQFVKQVSNGAGGVQRSRTVEEKKDVKPTYHWILNEIRNGEVAGTPHGRKFVAKGGIRLNRASIGFDGTATYMDGGSYAGTCVSDPELCSRGLSVEMTIKVDPAATMYRSPRYILDSGASSFNSRGVALYTMDNKLRADVAIKDKAYCLVVPLVTDKWQDVVLTYHKDGELNMYINCKLVATTENDDQCISCHTSGCHNSDTNTKLLLGRANGNPQSNFARFKAGDLSIYDKYLNPQDIDRICGFSKPQKSSPETGNYMPASPSWNSPPVTSYPNTQAGFLKSGISGSLKTPQTAMNAAKKAQTTSNAPYFSPWGGWTACSVSCGLGTQTRQRSCIYTHAQSGWQTCHGVTFQTKKCSSNCPGPRQSVSGDAQTAIRKDTRPQSKLNNAKSTTSKPAVSAAKTNNVKLGTTKDVDGARRDRISKIISKLGNLLGKLDQ
ncbi:uncharacterized protein LOC114523591 [Dendronephthya gigantea]|uniref:uncharacterized protein LOC114523591 n=1 Tax=Dendronephthya gigantea TaxID=151771 RepID=UPI00106D0D62|nr:uncharacterized protein LOC114523591 [Dendronephthya gigantea]